MVDTIKNNVDSSKVLFRRSLALNINNSELEIQIPITINYFRFSYHNPALLCDAVSIDPKLD